MPGRHPEPFGGNAAIPDLPGLPGADRRWDHRGSQGHGTAEISCGIGTRPGSPSIPATHAVVGAGAAQNAANRLVADAELAGQRAQAHGLGERADGRLCRGVW